MTKQEEIIQAIEQATERLIERMQGTNPHEVQIIRCISKAIQEEIE